MSVAIQMHGTRLAYVAVPIDGTVTRTVCTWDKMHGIRHKSIVQPGGFMVYFPQGHSLRLSKKELKHYHIDGEAPMLDMKQSYNPNSPIGKLLMAQDEAARKGAFKSLEQMVIKMATRKSGPNVLTREVEVEDPDLSDNDGE